MMPPSAKTTLGAMPASAASMAQRRSAAREMPCCRNLRADAGEIALPLIADDEVAVGAAGGDRLDHRAAVPQRQGGDARFLAHPLTAPKVRPRAM